MKVKSTNQIQVRRNNRRKQIGNLVTGALEYLKEETVENLAGRVSRRLGQPITQIYPAVNRTLNCGIRQGFIVKHGNKFSLPSTQNYETDFDSGTKEPQKFLHKDPLVNNEIARLLKYCELGNCQNITNQCNATDPQKRCTALDLITLRRCEYQRFTDFEFCVHHGNVLVALRYKIFYFQNFKRILGFFERHELSFNLNEKHGRKMDERIRKCINNQDEAVMQDAISQYTRFLSRYEDYIFVRGNAAYDAVIKRILDGSVDGFIDSTCYAKDLETGRRCYSTTEPYKHCDLHDILHTFRKIFIHHDEPGSGLNPDTITKVLGLDIAGTNLTNCEKEVIRTFPICFIYYLSIVTRLEDFAATRIPSKYPHMTEWTTLVSGRCDVNKAVGLERHENICYCKCLRNDLYDRLYALSKNVLRNEM